MPWLDRHGVPQPTIEARLTQVIELSRRTSYLYSGSSSSSLGGLCESVPQTTVQLQPARAT